jgi:ArsR family transcriptional regulator, arsenate/arsenite/antimonite-responsive transcriptional repressor
MESSQALAAFAALSQETRLAILRLLIRDGVEGVPAGEIASRLKVQPSTLSFHVAALERADLVTSRRVQRQILYAPNLEGIRGMVTFLLEDCCGGRPEICADIFSAVQPGCAPGCNTKSAGPVRKAARIRAARGRSPRA